nr:DUF1156 domain-containing protein [Candidatus Freyarchaeota archaeon]
MSNSREKIIEGRFPVSFISEITRIEAHNRKPIYNVHRWWARRPGTTFRAIIIGALTQQQDSDFDFKQTFYQKLNLGGKIVLDPMMGGGTTVVEALRVGCKVIGVDLNPVAWYVTKKEVEPIDAAKLLAIFKELEMNTAPKIKQYYVTHCLDCGKDVDVIYALWVRKINCTECNQEVLLFPSFVISQIRKEKTRWLWAICPNCRTIFRSKNENTFCPSCGLSISLEKGYTRGEKYFCPYCNKEAKIKKAINDIPKLEMFAIEYYCNTCRVRAYKKPDDFDIELYQSAKDEFLQRKDSLLFPKQKIPDGKEVRRLFGYHYRYFSQFFNERQLLCISELLHAILEIEDENAKEFFLLTLSDCLDYNNMFARYNKKARKIEPMFAHHAFYPKNMPAENNVWGTKFGRCSFIKCFKKLLKGEEYSKKPFEFELREKGTFKITISGDSIRAKIVESFDELTEGMGDTIIKCQSSDDLSFLPDKSVDAVITDPPYYDNVIYSELSDFYYVWLRIGLNQKYQCFAPEYTPRKDEIVVNNAMKKKKLDFLRGLTKIFSECHRVLKDDSLMIFTFHHTKEEAWASILEAVMNTGFIIKSVYPVHSEMRTSFHILGKGSTYDTIVVCKKKTTNSTDITWEDFVNKIKEYVEFTLQGLINHYTSLSKEDLLVIARGKCLELCSKHYPNIIKNMSKVTMLQALQDMAPIIEDVIKNKFKETIRQTASLDKFIVK